MQIRVYLAKALEDLKSSDAAVFASRFPAAIDGGSIRLDLPEQDPMLVEARAELLRLGFHAIGGDERRELKDLFNYGRYRVYDEADLEACELLRVAPRHQVRLCYPDLHSIGILKADVPQDGVEVAAQRSRPTIVSQSFRDRPGMDEFNGIAYGPLKLVKVKSSKNDTFTDLDWGVVGSPWWVLASTITLAPVSPYLQKFGGNNVPLPREALTAAVVEPGFSDVEL